MIGAPDATRRNRSARTLLACWLTVVATGTNVSHRHAAGSGHTHGFGWASVGGSQGAGLPVAHCHYVLFGVEFGAMECPPAFPGDASLHPGYGFKEHACP